VNGKILIPYKEEGCYIWYNPKDRRIYFTTNYTEHRILPLKELIDKIKVVDHGLWNEVTSKKFSDIPPEVKRKIYNEIRRHEIMKWKRRKKSYKKPMMDKWEFIDKLWENFGANWFTVVDVRKTIEVPEGCVVGKGNNGYDESDYFPRKLWWLYKYYFLIRKKITDEERDRLPNAKRCKWKYRFRDVFIEIFEETPPRELPWAYYHIPPER